MCACAHSTGILVLNVAFIYREWLSVAAVLFAVLAIGGSYFLATGSGAPQVAEASTETALLEQIATKDSTGDGLPDWQKALYGIPTDATTTDYFGDEVAGPVFYSVMSAALLDQQIQPQPGLVAPYVRLNAS